MILTRDHTRSEGIPPHWSLLFAPPICVEFCCCHELVRLLWHQGKVMCPQLRRRRMLEGRIQKDKVAQPAMRLNSSIREWAGASFLMVT